MGIRYENIHAPNEELDDGNFFVTFSAYEDKRSYFGPGSSKAIQTVDSNSTDDGMLVLERKDNGYDSQPHSYPAGPKQTL
ncbi:hypothetical protein [Pseudoglutamicibacter albus]|uniref:hypothetical protein n=1 Tax=Pseudoglutamicibacter albus TaxID=98671 RepID=UPI000AC34E40|nr:hypothetical protein [Pseudoglutamicibacter albus]